MWDIIGTLSIIKKANRNLWIGTATVVTLVVVIIILAACIYGGTLSQPANTIPAKIEKKTSEIDTSEGDESDRKVDSEVIETLSPTSQESGKQKPAKIPGIVQDALDKLYRGVPVESSDLLSVDDQGRIFLEFHAANAVGDSEKADLEALGATIDMTTEGISGLPGLGVIVVWIPYDQVEAAAALPWVVAVRPVEENPPDVDTSD